MIKIELIEIRFDVVDWIKLGASCETQQNKLYESSFHQMVHKGTALTLR